MFDAAGPLPYILLLALDSHVSQCMHIPYIVWQNVMYFRMLRTFMFVSHWRLCVKHRHTHPHRHTHCHNIFAHIWTKLNSKHFVEYYWLFSTDLSNVLLTSCRKFVECILCSERHLMSWPETETNTTNRTNEMSFVHIFSNAFSASMELTATILVACDGQFELPFITSSHLEKQCELNVMAKRMSPYDVTTIYIYIWILLRLQSLLEW